jgi:hypothetical protein
MDGSVVGRGCMALMLHVVYKGRALPLAWRVRQSPKGHCPEALHIAMVELLSTGFIQNTYKNRSQRFYVYGGAIKAGEGRHDSMRSRQGQKNVRILLANPFLVLNILKKGSSKSRP